MTKNWFKSPLICVISPLTQPQQKKKKKKICKKFFNIFQADCLREDFLVKTDDEVRRSVMAAIKKIDKEPIQGKI